MISVRGELSGLIGPSYRLRSINADCEQSINVFTERIESGAGKEKYSLRTTPGLLSVWSLGSNSRVRGMFELNGHVFAAVGDTLYDFISDGMSPESWIVNASVGPIIDDGKPVYFAANTDSLVFTSGGTAYQIFAGALSVIAWLPSVLSVGYLNTFFVFLAASQDGFYYSEPDDPSSGDILNFVTAEASANKFLRLIVDHQQVILFGNRITQVFQTTGDGDFPFAAIDSSGVIQYGIEAPACAAQADNALFFLGANAQGRGVTYRLNAYTPVRQSDHGVEYAIQTYSDTEEAVAWSYQEDGHVFVVLNFIESDKTWCYDISTGHWHRRAYWNSTFGQYEAHRGYCAVAAFGNVYVGDRSNGNIYRMSLDYDDDNGDVIRWERTSPDYAEKNQLVRFDRFEAVVQAGFGGSMSLRFSDNNGYTFSNERELSMGETGDYAHRSYTNSLGMARNRVWNLAGTGQVVIVGANFNGRVMST